MSRVAKGLSLVAGGGAVAPSGPAHFALADSTIPKMVGLRERPSGMGERWPLPAPSSPTLSELFAGHVRDAGWAGFLLPQVDRSRTVLWVQERMAILEGGRIHPPGLGLADLIHVEARDARAALWTMEEGLRCSALSAVIGEIWGDPASLDFTATRRLAVAAERSGVACWLVRLGGTANLSGARMRWRIASRPSLPNLFDPRASGSPAWDADLFRARGFPPGRWAVAHEGPPSKYHSDGTQADAFHLVAAPGDRALAERQRLTA